jgi:hypothetical protein
MRLAFTRKKGEARFPPLPLKRRGFHRVRVGERTAAGERKKRVLLARLWVLLNT